MRKQITIILFAIVALAQLYVPATMILDREEILSEGKEFKFRTAPVDPNDPFRGKYITLSYKDNRVKVDHKPQWESYDGIYAYISSDKNGYARIDSVSRDKPSGHLDFLKTDAYMSTENMLFVQLPFDRFYMEESKAPVAETVYAQTMRDTSQVAFALVNVKNGEAVIKDVMIEGKSLTEIVKERNSIQKTKASPNP